ncbi:MAG: hypothetical protein RBR86_00575 [Pseudobdellovibrionaceae bacterium]|jgi:hypothetical protein|nr:hypothetical protein [Pseudobdellovibrionaceae bacterium]
MSYHVFHVCGPKDAPMAGIGDYIINSANALLGQGFSSSYVSRASHGIVWDDTAEATMEKIIAKETPAGKIPIIHTHMAVPFCGAGLSPEFLKKYKSVATVHEIKELDDAGQLYSLDFIEAVDGLIYTMQSEYDFTQALIEKHNRNIDLAAKTVFIMVPAGIPDAEDFETHHKGYESKSNDVAFFGMIRPGRGMEGTLVSFANKLKAAQPESTLRIVGSSVWEEVSVPEIDNILHELSIATFPAHVSELQECSGPVLVDKILELQNSTSPKDRALNIHIHFDEEIKDVVSILSGCKFAYMPFTRGATDHSSSLPTTVGLCPITISNIGVQTKGNVQNVLYPSENADEAVEIISDFISGSRAPLDMTEAISTYMNERSWKNLAMISNMLYEKLVS